MCLNLHKYCTFVDSAEHEEGDLGLSASTVTVQNMTISEKILPVITSAGEVLLQLSNLCDKHKCNKRLFLALKSRLQVFHWLFFSETGILTI